VGSSILLVCSVLVALGIGVLLAYGVCVVLFHLFHMHAMQAEYRRRAQTAEAVLAEG
jgi:hypothetical protein